MTKTFDQIAAECRWGSEGFVRAVETYCNLQISREEIRRIAGSSTCPKEFMAIWHDGDWWTDENAARQNETSALIDNPNYVGSRHHY
jgi:hypothetical protein